MREIRIKIPGVSVDSSYCWLHYWTPIKKFLFDDVHQIKKFKLLLRLLGLRTMAEPYKVNVFTPSNAWVDAMRSCHNRRSVWSLIILLFLASHPIYELVVYSRENKWTENRVVDIMLESMIPTHYLLSYVYFCTNHIDMFTKRDGGQGIEFRTVIRRPCRIPPNSLSYMSLLSASIVTSLSVYTSNGHYASWFLIQRAIGFCIMSLNIFSLIYIFCKHINAVQSYATILSDEGCITYTQTTLACFIKNIIELRESLRVTRSLFSYMVSYSVIVCGIVTGIVINSNDMFKFDYWVYISLVSFCTLYSILLYIIWQVSESKNNIQQVIQGGSMARRYLIRDADNRTRNRVSETATSVDWWILRTELDSKWIEFVVMGIPIHNGTFVKQVVAAVAFLQVFGKSLLSRYDS